VSDNAGIAPAAHPRTACMKGIVRVDYFITGLKFVCEVGAEAFDKFAIQAT